MSVFKTKPTLITALVSSLFLAGCGGSSTDGGTTSSTDGGTTSSTGVFIDSAVSGISYKTATHNDVTNADGEYQYEAGETVTFSIGGVNFPPVAAKAVVTPFDMSSTPVGQNNIGMLLQSFDSDGVASNGISITSSTLSDFEGVASPDFEVADLPTFRAQFSSVIASDDSRWKSKAEVEAHLANASGYVGTWLLATSDTDGLVFLKITADGQYLLLSDQDEYDGKPDSLQNGKYAFDTETNTVVFSKTEASDFADIESGVEYVLNASEDLNSFEIVFNENDAPKFNRIVDLADEVKEADALYGIWEFDKSDSITDDKLITFNKDNSYMVFSLEGNNTTGKVEYEKGNYEIVDSTLSVTVTDNGDGDKGLGNATSIFFDKIGSDGLELTVSFEGETQTVGLTKILPF